VGEKANRGWLLAYLKRTWLHSGNVPGSTQDLQRGAAKAQHSSPNSECLASTIVDLTSDHPQARVTVGDVWRSRVTGPSSLIETDPSGGDEIQQ